MNLVERPNIVLLILDAVRADHLSCYGYARPTSPFLESLAGESILYESCIAPANWTVPSHASIFTGLYPSAHNTHFRNLRLPADIPTLAELLQQANYQTCAITGNAWISPVTDLHRGFESYHGMWPSYKRAWLKQMMLWSNVVIREVLGRRDKGGQHALQALQRWLSERDKSRPFFLFVNLMEAHAPYRVPRGCPGSEFTAGQRVPRHFRNPHLGVDYIANKATLTESDLTLLSDLYDGSVRYADELTHRLVEHLQEAGLYDSTMLIVTSDHGESLGDEGILGHQFKLSADLLHVPLIIKLPNKVERGTRVSAPVQLVDLAPTALEMAGIDQKDQPVGLEGYSILPEHIGDMQREFIIAEDIGPEVRVLRRRHGEAEANRWDVDQWLVSADHWSYVERSDGTTRTNGRITHDDVARAQQFLASWRNRPNARYTPNKEAVSGAALDEMDESAEILERLRSLGYVE